MYTNNKQVAGPGQLDEAAATATVEEEEGGEEKADAGKASKQQYL